MSTGKIFKELRDHAAKHTSTNWTKSSIKRRKKKTGNMKKPWKTWKKESFRGETSRTHRWKTRMKSA